MTDTLLSRRQFFCALAASVVAAGVPLPVGVDLSRDLFFKSVRLEFDDPAVLKVYWVGNMTVSNVNHVGVIA